MQVDFIWVKYKNSKLQDIFGMTYQIPAIKEWENTVKDIVLMMGSQHGSRSTSELAQKYYLKWLHVACEH